MKQTAAVLIFLGGFLISLPSFGETYRITTIGQAAESAVREFSAAATAQNPDIQIDFAPNIAGPNDFIPFLEKGLFDIAVVPFETLPQLANSPLLQPFLSEDAIGVRRTIDSEVGAFAKADLQRNTNLRTLDFWHVASTIFATKNPVRRVDDLQGLKFAAPPTQASETLTQLGMSQVAIPAGEVVIALERGALDSSAVPIDNGNLALGFAQVVTNYVDRLYKPSLYAVVITKDRWESMPYPDQYALARAATMVGEGLVSSLNVQAKTFKEDALARGDVFAPWNSTDVDQVRVASLAAVGDNVLNQSLVQLAYEAATADLDIVPFDRTESRPQANVDILFATDRTAVPQGTLETAYSAGRKLDGVTFGHATVRLTANRKYGDDLKDTTKLIEVVSVSKTEFTQAVSASDEIVLFVHGYNNSYSDVIRRASTIKADIAPEATIVSYTWPSEGAILAYGYDEQSTSIAEQNFKIFMQHMTSHVPAERINIIAHSMGSRTVLSYIDSLASRHIFPEQVKFRNIVFAASDVAQELFQQKVENPLVSNYPISRYANHVTVYSSQYDRPLGLSKKLHGGGTPLGLAKPETLYLQPDVTTVDASAIDPARWYQRFSFATRHSYVFDKSAGVRDLALLLAGTPPSQRPGMKRKTRGSDVYWELNP